MKSKFILFASALALAASANAQTKNCLIEEFSSSTCPPCASLNAWFDPLAASFNANKPGSGLVVLKYQMYFPSPGTDASYNAHGQSRASHYISGLPSWGIPVHFTNGKWQDTSSSGGTSSSIVTNEINTCKGGTANMTITGTYYVKSTSATQDSLIMSVTITPKTNITGGTYKLYVAASEEHYQNTSTTTGHTTSQVDFYHVMRQMYPDGNGTTVTNLTANTPQTFTFKDTITIGGNMKGNFNWWGNPFNGSLVVFVADESQPLRSAANILQAVAIPAQYALNVEKASNFKNLNIAPNPVSDNAAVFFNLGEATDVSISVMDMMGRVVRSVPAQHYGLGVQRVMIPCDGLANGTYFLNMQSDKGSISERFIISK